MTEIQIEENKSLNNIEELFLIERECFQDMAWSKTMLKEELKNPFSKCFVAKEKNNVLGYLLGRVILDEGEILRLAVRPAFQKRGIGSKLLASFLEELKNLKIKRVFLEVSEENKRALRLYQKFNFNFLYFRKNYYEKNKALVMECEILK